MQAAAIVKTKRLALNYAALIGLFASVASAAPAQTAVARAMPSFPPSRSADAASTSYAKASLLAFARNWDALAFETRLDPDYFGTVDFSDLPNVFAELRQDVGPLRAFEIKSSRQLSRVTPEGKITGAFFRIRARFAKGWHFIQISLVNQGDGWHLVGFVAPDTKADPQSRAVADAAFRAITRAWDISAVDARASPELYRRTTRAAILHSLHRDSQLLATMKSYKLRDTVQTLVISPRGFVSVANFMFDAIFAKAPGTVYITLREQSDEPWKVSGLVVSSYVLMQS